MLYYKYVISRMTYEKVINVLAWLKGIFSIVLLA